MRSEHEEDDEPEESEEAEYAYHPRQLEYLRTHHPEFRFGSLDEIPVVASPPMRTCDNLHYTSRAHGDPRDAEGLLYSVPLYAPDGRFRGLISAIFRTNVLEAALLGVPNVIVTPEDVQRARSQRWGMPEQPGDLVLACPTRGLWIGDRRDPRWLADVRRSLRPDGRWQPDAAHRADPPHRRAQRAHLPGGGATSG